MDTNAMKAAGRSLANGRLVANSDNRNTSTEMKTSTPQAKLPAARMPKINMGPSNGWTLQTKVTTPAINHINHPKASVNVGVSQAEQTRRAMAGNKAKVIGTGVGY